MTTTNNNNLWLIGFSPFLIIIVFGVLGLGGVLVFNGYLQLVEQGFCNMNLGLTSCVNTLADPASYSWTEGHFYREYPPLVRTIYFYVTITMALGAFLVTASYTPDAVWAMYGSAINSKAIRRRR